MFDISKYLMTIRKLVKHHFLYARGVRLQIIRNA